MSIFKLVLLSIFGIRSAFHLAARLGATWPVLGFLFAALGCLLIGGFASTMSDRVRTGETSLRPESVATQLLSGFSYFAWGCGGVIIIAAILQGFGLIHPHFGL
jgi:hypothetical protein